MPSLRRRPSLVTSDSDKASAGLRTITRAEHQTWLRRLSNWQSPDAMRAKVDEIVEHYGEAALTSPRSAFFREAHAASAFAADRGAAQVRLVHPDPRPDFEVRLHAGAEPETFELVEADWPGRQRSREFHEAGPGAIDFPESEWLTPEAAQAMLAVAARVKSDGRYETSCNLLIYLNPIEFGVHQVEVEAVMQPATADAASHFRSVWVLWKGVAYRTWGG